MNMIPLPELKWVDHSKRPIVGMLCELYINGELMNIKVESWNGNKCYFTNGYSLYYNDDLGFGYY